MECNEKIGIIDSGVGGLTLVREIMELCPGEDIIYFGDSANCPYGNRSLDEVYALAMDMLLFMEKMNVKTVAIACNTISALEERLSPVASMPVFGIVLPVSRAVAQSGLKHVGVYATELTISSGIYTRLIQSFNQDIKVYGVGSHSLARQVERGEDDSEIDKEIETGLNKLLSGRNLSHVILGCTHFPIVEENFHRAFPHITFINPAKAQADTIIAYLQDNGLANTQKKGSLSIYTSGGTRSFEIAMDKLGIPKPFIMETTKKGR